MCVSGRGIIFLEFCRICRYSVPYKSAAYTSALEKVEIQVIRTSSTRSSSSGGGGRRVTGPAAAAAAAAAAVGVAEEDAVEVEAEAEVAAHARCHQL